MTKILFKNLIKIRGWKWSRSVLRLWSPVVVLGRRQAIRTTTGRNNIIKYTVCRENTHVLGETPTTEVDTKPAFTCKSLSVSCEEEEGEAVGTNDHDWWGQVRCLCQIARAGHAIGMIRDLGNSFHLFMRRRLTNYPARATERAMSIQLAFQLRRLRRSDRFNCIWIEWVE